jgi:hypothetical protein
MLRSRYYPALCSLSSQHGNFVLKYCGHAGITCKVYHMWGQSVRSTICEVSEEDLPYVSSVRKVYHMWSQWGRFTIFEVSDEGSSYVRSVRKVYHMWGQWGRLTICEVSEEGLPHVHEVSEEGLMSDRLLNTKPIWNSNNKPIFNFFMNYSWVRRHNGHMTA